MTAAGGAGHSAAAALPSLRGWYLVCAALHGDEGSRAARAALDPLLQPGKGSQHWGGPGRGGGSALRQGGCRAPP